MLSTIDVFMTSNERTDKFAYTINIIKLNILSNKPIFLTLLLTKPFDGSLKFSYHRY